MAYNWRPDILGLQATHTRAGDGCGPANHTTRPRLPDCRTRASAFIWPPAAPAQAMLHFPFCLTNWVPLSMHRALKRAVAFDCRRVSFGMPSSSRGSTPPSRSWSKSNTMARRAQHKQNRSRPRQTTATFAKQIMCRLSSPARSPESTNIRSVKQANHVHPLSVCYVYPDRSLPSPCPCPVLARTGGPCQIRGLQGRPKDTSPGKVSGPRRSCAAPVRDFMRLRAWALVLARIFCVVV